MSFVAVGGGLAAIGGGSAVAGGMMVGSTALGAASSLGLIGGGGGGGSTQTKLKLTDQQKQTHARSIKLTEDKWQERLSGAIDANLARPYISQMISGMKDSQELLSKAATKSGALQGGGDKGQYVGTSAGTRALLAGQGLAANILNAGHEGLLQTREKGIGEAKTDMTNLMATESQQGLASYQTNLSNNLYANTLGAAQGARIGQLGQMVGQLGKQYFQNT